VPIALPGQRAVGVGVTVRETLTLDADLKIRALRVIAAVTFADSTQGCAAPSQAELLAAVGGLAAVGVESTG